jgi:twitching motility protein PilT
MSAKDSSLLGRVAVAAKLISMEQLAEATREQARQNYQKNLGDILVELGYLTPAGLQRAVALQKTVVERAQRNRTTGAPAASPVPAKAAAPAPAARPGEKKAEEPQPLAQLALTRTPQLSRSVERPFEPAGAQDAKAMAPGAPDELGASTDAGASSSLASEARRAGPAPAAAPPIPDTPVARVLAKAVELGASDVHIHSGAPLRYRIHGRLVDQTPEPLTADQAGPMALSLLGPQERAIFEERGEVDFSYTLEGHARFRTNLYRQLRGIDATLRRVPLAPPTLEELGLPNSLARFTNYHQGMVLLTGPTRCGKSSTMAALVNLINEERSEHVLTIEDPIEYLHRSNRCLVNQRNVGRHTQSFARALRAALREDPDVIVIGELRDRETVSLALTAAETGHFVLATLHTDNAVRTVNRIVGSFPPDQQEQVRAMMSESLRAVISQRLLPRADGAGMVAALEVMIVTRAISNLIRESKLVQIRSILQTGKSQGMSLLDNSLAELVTKKVVTREEALRHADDAKLIPA